MRVKLGIDPGLSGALAVLSEPDFKCLGVYDMPVMAGVGKRQQVNAVELANIIKRSLMDFSVTAYLERVNSFPHQGVSSMFSFGTSYGIVLGVLGTLQIPTVLVQPMAWKKRAGLWKKEKDAARTMAIQLYPKQELARKRDIGRADAILIARFGV